MSEPSSSQTATRQNVQPPSTGFLARLRCASSTVIHHARKHAGVGIICAVAYFDPGNWGVDLQAGSEFGYHLLFVVLVAGLFGAFLQVLASRLGCVTGIDLAAHSRLLLYNRPKHTLWYRWLGLYPLYLFAEVAIIATDLAELLGSAIALCLLFPQLQLWHGVLITAFDVILLLAMGDPLRGKPVRMFEALIAAMVLGVLVCMIAIISKVDVDWARAFEGFVPSKQMFASGGIYTSVGIVGATVMPHSLFLGSALATQDRISFREHPDNAQPKTVTSNVESRETLLPQADPNSSRLGSWMNELKETILGAFRKPPANLYARAATRHSEHTNNPFEFVRAHIYHGTVDIVGCLLGFAVMINSLILMLASAVFFYGNSQNRGDNPASLFDAYDLIRDVVGQPAATLFAIALLCSGQSSSIIGTVAGQAVSEGFLQWRVSPVLRRLITRLLAIIPSMVVAISFGRGGIDTLLVASQVVLSIVLPFVTFPLLYCTSSKAIMTVRRSQAQSISGGVPATLTSMETPSIEAVLRPQEGRSASAVENANEDLVDYSNNMLSTIIGVAIWLIVVAANIYAIVELAMGQA